MTMVKETAIIYKSFYGTTERYAKLIAKIIDGDLYDQKHMSMAKGFSYRHFIFGGCVIAGKISGIEMFYNFVKDFQVRNFVLFTVGIGNNPEEKKKLEEEVLKHCPKEQHAYIRIFHFPGNCDFSKLNFVHKQMLKMVFLMTKKKKVLTEEDKQTLALENHPVEGYDEQAVEGLIDWMRKICILNDF